MKDGFQAGGEFRAEFVEFFAVGAAEAVEQGGAGAGERDEDFAMIGIAVGAVEEAAGAEAVDEFDGAVMADEEAGGEFADEGAGALWQAGDCEKKLVLAGFEAVGACLFLAEVEEAVDLEAEVGEQAVVGLSEGLGSGSCGAHRNIVPRYISFRRSAIRGRGCSVRIRQALCREQINSGF